MYRNAVYDSRSRAIKLFTWDEDGNRVSYDASFSPYLYVEDTKGEKKSIYQTKVTKKIFNTSYDRNKFVSTSGIRRLYENISTVQQYLLDTFWQVNETPEFTKNDLKVVFLDIETYSPSSEGFPDTNNPTHPINVITCYDTLSRTYYTFGTGAFKTDRADIIYTHCKNEKDLFIKFVEYLEDDYPDVLSGWSSEFFDIPYIVNRCERVMGEDFVKRLSPTGRVYFREILGKYGKQQKRYYIEGISCIDYMDIYRRFCLKLRESYKLDAIGELELGMNKIDYGDIDLATLADTDWNKFIEYNIMDVNIIVKLEEKLQYVNLLKMLAYVGLTTLEGAMGTLSVITGALTIRARNRGEIISTFIRKQDEGKNPGAYVSEPKRGFQSNVVSFDANSLYPNVMISLNLSPETKIGRVEKVDDSNVNIYHVSGKILKLTNEKFAQFIKHEECSLSKAGFLFTQKRKGIIPEFLDYYYDQRKIVKKKLGDLKQQQYDLKQKQKEKDSEDIRRQLAQISVEISRANTLQMVQKVLLNSCYGFMGNKQASIGDDDIASSVTLTGQAVIKQAGKLLQQYLSDNFGITDREQLDSSWIYSDTDSCYFSLECIEDQVKLKDGNNVSDHFYETVQNIEDFLNGNINKWAVAALRSKDPRFVFKRETIADTALMLQKKRYVIHVLDEEGIKAEKFKYTGVEVVRTSMPNAVKPYAKNVIETMLTTRSLLETNRALKETYDIFKTLPVEDIASVMGLKGYEKYSTKCKDLSVGKGTPIHVKAAYLHNTLTRKLGIDNKYEDINSGDKVRYLYVEQPNKYKVDVIGFKYQYPAEFAELFKIDYEKMFEKILFNSIERFYESVDWQIRKPSMSVRTELADLFS